LGAIHSKKTMGVTIMKGPQAHLENRECGYYGWRGRERQKKRRIKNWPGSTQGAHAPVHKEKNRARKGNSTRLAWTKKNKPESTAALPGRRLSESMEARNVGGGGKKRTQDTNREKNLKMNGQDSYDPLTRQIRPRWSSLKMWGRGKINIRKALELGSEKRRGALGFAVKSTWGGEET